jgi:hypothetical protein
MQPVTVRAVGRTVGDVKLGTSAGALASAIE